MTRQDKDYIEHQLQHAQELCVRRGTRLTALRSKVLRELLAADAPVKAYDLIERLRDQGEKLTPATIYRTLDFLLECGLVHKINAINAFVACTCHHQNNSLLLFVCSRCQQVTEIDDPSLFSSMRSRLAELGICLDGNTIEMQGLCSSCAKSAPEAPEQPGQPAAGNPGTKN